MFNGSKRRRLLRLCRKELRETARDRRTILTLVLMPLLVYPLLSMALNRFLLSSGSPQEDGYTVGVQTEAEGQLLREWINDPRSQPPEAIVRASGGGVAEFNFLMTGPVTARDAVEQNRVDVGARVEPGGTNSPPVVRLFAYRGDAASSTARRVMVERLHWRSLRQAEDTLRQIVTQNAGPNRYIGPALIAVDDVGEASEPSTLGTIVPLVLVLMTITGAVYPAIDLTAGERERGTMEALMASPAPRGAVLFAKYVAVVVVALFTAVANVLAMFTTLWVSGLLGQLTGSDTFPWVAVIQILGLLVLFSAFFSAVLLSLTSFARSFKEAQAYLIPVMLLSLAPAMLSLLPGVTLSGPLAVAPLINMVLLARDVLAGSIQPVGAVLAITSTVGYAAAALTIAAKLFGDDAVTRTSDLSIGTLLRRPRDRRNVASGSAAAMIVAILVPIYFLTSSGLMRWLGGLRERLVGDAEQLADDQMLQLQMTSMILSAIALFFVFGLVPLAAAVWERCRLRTAYRVKASPPPAYVGVALLGLGAWAAAHELLLLMDAVGLATISEEQIEKTRAVLQVWQSVPPWLILVCLSLTPAVVEELCFRGYLFSSLGRILSPTRTILLSAVLFGLFHVLTGATLLFERFAPSTFLGVILGWVAYRTRSVIPGIVLHLIHNGLLEMVGHYKDTLIRWGLDATVVDGEDVAHLPVSWIATATTLAVVGAVIVGHSTRSRRNPVDPPTDDDETVDRATGVEATGDQG